jgi:hypothetical protein
VGKAPDGTPGPRTKVAVNEPVAMNTRTPAAPPVWTATGGTFVATGGSGIVWTAPAVVPSGGAVFTVTATPVSGTPCTVAMNVVPPSHRELTRIRDLSYDDNRSGSGFDAVVAIRPADVAFDFVEVREGAAEGKASGYYDSILHWDKKPHALGDWSLADPDSVRITDLVGTEEPGGPAPFSVGTFEWKIPQFYRPFGGAGDGEEYGKAVHLQTMAGADGAETSEKDGARRERTPGPRAPPPVVGAPRPDGEP